MKLLGVSAAEAMGIPSFWDPEGIRGDLMTCRLPRSAGASSVGRKQHQRPSPNESE